MMDDDLKYRVAELEERAQRLVLAGNDRDGWGAWHNHLELRLMQERDLSDEVIGRLLAETERKILAACKVAIEQTLTQRIRGTFDPQAKYVACDVIALDGASFVARRDNPGPCPGPGWQLLAQQGKRGKAGEAGRDAAKIVGWIVDRGRYTATPRFSDGSLGPVLELRELFLQFQNDTSAA